MATRPSYAAMAQHASFEHERLMLADRSIRLFQVQRGAKHEPLSLRMTQFSAYRRPPYKAISYTWGSAENPQEILVNGKAFGLHVNLWHLLYHLRQTGEMSFLWADALCINQLNMKERNFHVQLMGKIYEKAESVIVWLGLPSADRTEIRAMDFIKEIAAYRKSNSDAMFGKRYLKADMRHRWHTLLRFTDVSYWHRTWVIQEFLFAPELEIYSGSSKLEWKDYEALVELLRSDKRFEQNPVITKILSSRTTRLTLRRKAAGQTTLHELLQEYSDSKCTERRDKIYGILGLALDCAEDPDSGKTKGMQADYEKHIIEVFLDALECIQASLASPEVVPAATLLILQTLHVTHRDLSSYILEHFPSPSQGLRPSSHIIANPTYVSPVLRTWQWTSIRNLQQQLEFFDWGEFVGYEVSRVSSNQLLPPSRGIPPRLRRNSSRTIHSALPLDFIPNVVEAANLALDISLLHNYTCIHELQLSKDHISLHAEDRRLWDNVALNKPLLILEQDSESDILRLGFACTNTQRGDLIIQFDGLDTALIVRQIGLETRLVGKAKMIKHSGLEHEKGVDPVCDTDIWTSHCWRSCNSEALQLGTDALSLAELLMKS